MCFVCPCRVEVVACLIHSLSRSSFQKYIFTLKHCPIQSGSSLILPNQNLIFLKFQISRKQLNINKWYFFYFLVNQKKFEVKGNSVTIYHTSGDHKNMLLLLPINKMILRVLNRAVLYRPPGAKSN